MNNPSRKTNVGRLAGQPIGSCLNELRLMKLKLHVNHFRVGTGSVVFGRQTGRCVQLMGNGAGGQSAGRFHWPMNAVATDQFLTHRGSDARRR